MANKVYDSYLKTWFYVLDDGKRTFEPPLEEKSETSKVEAPKKKWFEFWK
jgi:hypothetical protein